MERELVAVLAAQHVRARADAHEQTLVPGRHLSDRQRGGRGNLAQQQRDAVAFQHPPRLGRGRGRIDRVLGYDLERPAEYATRLVDLLFADPEPQHGVLSERAEEAGQGRKVTEPDLVRLGAADHRQPERARARKRGSALQSASAAVGGGHCWLLPAAAPVPYPRYAII